MSARIAKEELSLLLPNTMSHYFHDDHNYQATTKGPGLLARLSGMLRWLAEMPKRRAVLDELSMLSDHELADIGLNRGELPRVFDPSFAADREATRFAANDFDRRARAA